MALALMFNSDDSVIFLDAVTNYGKSRQSNISSHPVDSSSLISDHVTKNNPTFSIRAVVSAADFNTTYTRAESLVSGENQVIAEQNQPVNGATINSVSSLLDYLPQSVQNIFGQASSSSVELDPFRGYNHQTIRDRLNDAWENSEIVTLIDEDFDIHTGRNVAVRVYEDCIITRYEDNEDETTGDSLVANLTIEKIRYAYLKEVDVQISKQTPSAEVSDEAASEKDYGDQTSTGESLADENEDGWLADYIENEGAAAIRAIQNLPQAF